jgi:16S rRNA (cytosine967-C5)-methyltransferase
LESVQFSIIRDYSNLLKIGGTMVYATCSILPKENRHQVDAFLAHPAGAQFELLEDQTVDPSEHNDGFYMARLRKFA